MARSARPDAATLAAWQGWLLAHRAVVNQLDAELRVQAAISLDDYDVLVQLALAERGRLTMSRLAGALLLARSSCTRIVGRLEARGWVDRVADPADGRVVWAVLTPAGRKVQRRAAAVHLAGVQERFGRHLRAGDAAAIASLAARITGAAPPA